MPIFPKKRCPISELRLEHIDYKNAVLLHRFLDYYNRIKRREHTGVSLRNQKKLATAIKRARHVALCGFVR